MRIALLVPFGFAAGAALCGWMLRAAPARIAVDRDQPLIVVTYWQQFGARMWLALALALAIATAGYIATLLRVDKLSVSGIVALSASACVAALAFPVVFSSDVYAYAGYGDMALHAINPYAHVRLFVHDPLLDAVVWQWGNPPPMCVYGPAFVWLARVVVALFAPLGAAAPLWALRVISCMALAACAPLGIAAFASFPQRTRFAAAAGIALNPVAIWSAAEGHNDPIALAIVLAGFALVQRARPMLGALVIVLCALVKAPGALAAAGLALVSWRDRPRFAKIVAGAAVGAAIVLALAFPLEYGVRTHLLPSGHYQPQFSLQYISIPMALGLAALLAVAGLRALAVRQFDGAVVLALAAWIAVPNPYPWYAIWLIPLAFLVWNTRAGWAVVLASVLIALRYYGEATAVLSTAANDAIIACIFAPPLMLLGAHMVTARRDRRENRRADLGFAPTRSR